MKGILKFFGGCLIVIYLFIAIGLTICLLNYNDYKITVINDNSILIVEDDTLAPQYKKGDLLLIKKNANEDIKVNDKIFFYNQYEGKVVVNMSTVTKAEKITETETTYTIDNKYELSSEYVIGKTETTKVYHDFGRILGLLESKWGFLGIIILPISLLFIYEIYAVIMEIKNPKAKNKKKVKVNDNPKPIEAVNSNESEKVLTEEAVESEKVEDKPIEALKEDNIEDKKEDFEDKKLEENKEDVHYESQNDNDNSDLEK